ncbi:MAG: hypothetical protein Ct9H300mP18_11430 [Candidatus Neomarinimicrobiota bacterium]|nr:MAG: hypothetical protein Ct9H300mP18_11430 [Candidatus Neomarinimicrobiota bacterium]
MLEKAAKTVKETNIDSWNDIDRLDVRIEKELQKLELKIGGKFRLILIQEKLYKLRIDAQILLKSFMMVLGFMKM